MSDDKVQMTLEQIKALRTNVRVDEPPRVSAYIDVLTQWADAADAELAAERERADRAELRVLNYGLSGRAAEEMEKLRDDLAAERAKVERLREAIEGLRYPYEPGLCWCGVATGHPMLTKHSAACDAARAALEDER